MAKNRIESKYVTVAPGVELHILEKGEGKRRGSVRKHLCERIGVV